MASNTTVWCAEREEQVKKLLKQVLDERDMNFLLEQAQKTSLETEVRAAVGVLRQIT